MRSGGLNDAQDHAQEEYSDHGEDDKPQEDSDGVVEDYTGTLEDDAEDADECGPDPEADYKHTAPRASMDDAGSSLPLPPRRFHRGEVEWVALGASEDDLVDEFNKAISKKLRDDDQATYWTCSSDAVRSATRTAESNNEDDDPRRQQDSDADPDENAKDEPSFSDAAIKVQIRLPTYAELCEQPIEDGPIKVNVGPVPARLRLGQVYLNRDLAIAALNGHVTLTGKQAKKLHCLTLALGMRGT